jgi:signal transduction histidine kinase
MSEALDQLKSQFLATVSHDLRNPLNVIVGFATLLENRFEQVDPADRQTMISSIARQSRYLAALVNNILDYAKMDAGELTLTPHPTDVLKLLQAIFQEQQHTAVAKALDLTLHLQTPRGLWVDKVRLEQIVVNLVDNAIKFTDVGSVNIQAHYVDGCFCLSVQDTGIGIPTEALNTIFDPFRQVDGTDRRKYKGTGLGLAIVRHLVRLMNGTISVKSQVGQGSVFEVVLPLSAVPESELEEDAEEFE